MCLKVPRVCSLLAVFVFGIFQMVAQSVPFQKGNVIQGYRLGDLLVNEEDEMRVVTYSPPFNTNASKLLLVEPNAMGDVFDAVEIYSPQIGDLLFKFLEKAAYTGTSINLLQGLGFSAVPGPLFIHYDTESGALWAKASTLTSDFSSFSTDTEGNTLFVLTMQDTFDRVALYYFDSGGQVLWQESVQFIKPELDPFRLFSYDVLYDEDSDSFIVLGAFANVLGEEGENRSFLLQVYPDGNLGAGIVMGDADFQKLSKGEPGFFVVGKEADNSGFSRNEYNAAVAYFDGVFNLSWAKVFWGHAFEYNDASLEIQDGGSLFFGYSTTGYFPAVLATLDTQGDILTQRGYSFYDPRVRVLSTGALALVSSLQITAGGDVIPNMTIAKTDSLGLFDDCEVYSACLQNLPFIPEIDFFSTSVAGADSLMEVSLVTGSTQLLFEDVCQSLAAPSPFFSTSDTLCTGESIQAENTSNELANENRWELLDEDGVVVDAVENEPGFQYSFSEPGHYTLIQTIWYLGCDYSHEQTVVVLPDLEVSIEQDGAYCEPPLSLTVASNRPVAFYDWGNDVHDPSIDVLEGGTYALSVSDGFCEASTSVEISFVSELLQGSQAISLPEDSSLCEVFFPYELYATSPLEGGVITFDGKPVENWPVLLPEEGSYVFSVELDHCILSDSFNLEAKNCEEHIFLPNVFSPNGDGFNDLFLAQGKNFIPLKLTIFSRWGSIVAEITEEPFVWDGGHVNSGIYLYFFEYFNPLTAQSGVLSGDVLLLR